MNETFANGGTLPTYEADNMMTMLNQTNIRNSLSRMNAANKMRNSMMARKAAYRKLNLKKVQNHFGTIKISYKSLRTFLLC